jgi:hypothetical protein
MDDPTRVPNDALDGIPNRQLSRFSDAAPGGRVSRQ